LQIFLDPLRKVGGSCLVNDLIQCCSSAEQRGFFQALGMCLGHDKWVEDWREMMAERNLQQEVGVVGVESKHLPMVESINVKVAEVSELVPSFLCHISLEVI
jgi:hypothetical protein